MKKVKVSLLIDLSALCPVSSAQTQSRQTVPPFDLNSSVDPNTSIIVGSDISRVEDSNSSFVYHENPDQNDQTLIASASFPAPAPTPTPTPTPKQPISIPQLQTFILERLTKDGTSLSPASRSFDNSQFVWSYSFYNSSAKSGSGAIYGKFGKKFENFDYNSWERFEGILKERVESATDLEPDRDHNNSSSFSNFDDSIVSVGGPSTIPGQALTHLSTGLKNIISDLKWIEEDFEEDCPSSKKDSNSKHLIYVFLNVPQSEDELLEFSGSLQYTSSSKAFLEALLSKAFLSQCQEKYNIRVNWVDLGAGDGPVPEYPKPLPKVLHYLCSGSILQPQIRTVVQDFELPDWGYFLRANLKAASLGLGIGTNKNPVKNRISDGDSQQSGNGQTIATASGTGATANLKKSLDFSTIRKSISNHDRLIRAGSNTSLPSANKSLRSDFNRSRSRLSSSDLNSSSPTVTLPLSRGSLSNLSSSTTSMNTTTNPSSRIPNSNQMHRWVEQNSKRPILVPVTSKSRTQDKDKVHNAKGHGHGDRDRDRDRGRLSFSMAMNTNTSKSGHGGSASSKNASMSMSNTNSSFNFDSSSSIISNSPKRVRRNLFSVHEPKPSTSASAGFRFNPKNTNSLSGSGGHSKSESSATFGGFSSFPNLKSGPCPSPKLYHQSPTQRHNELFSPASSTTSGTFLSPSHFLQSPSPTSNNTKSGANAGVLQQEPRAKRRLQLDSPTPKASTRAGGHGLGLASPVSSDGVFKKPAPSPGPGKLNFGRIFCPESPATPPSQKSSQSTEGLSSCEKREVVAESPENVATTTTRTQAGGRPGFPRHASYLFYSNSNSGDPDSNKSRLWETSGQKLRAAKIKESIHVSGILDPEIGTTGINNSFNFSDLLPESPVH